MMRTKKVPYELLVRWNQQGNLAGAHVQYRFVITDDADQFVTETVGNPEPLVIGEFPLTDLLSHAEALALSENTILHSQVVDMMVDAESLRLQVTGLNTNLEAARTLGADQAAMISHLETTLAEVRENAKVDMENMINANTQMLAEANAQITALKAQLVDALAKAPAAATVQPSEPLPNLDLPV